MTKDPREETHFDPDFSRRVRGELSRLRDEQARSARAARRFRTALVFAALGVAATGALGWWVATRTAGPGGTFERTEIEGLLVRERYGEARALLARVTGSSHPTTLRRWEAIVSALSAEADRRNARDWNGAMESLAAALSAGGSDGWVLRLVERRRKTLDAALADAEVLREAKARLSAEDPAGAERMLAGISAASPYAEEAEALRLACRTLLAVAATAPVEPDPKDSPRDPVPSDADREGARLYAAGRGEEALAVAGISPALAERIDAVHRAYEEGIRELTLGQWVLAARHFRRIVERESDPANRYRLRAAEGLREIRAASADLTGPWLDQARRLDAEGRHAEAFRLARDVEVLAPESSDAAQLLSRIQGLAPRLYEEGYLLLTIDPAKARERWAQALELLPEEDPLRDRIRSQMPK